MVATLTHMSTLHSVSRFYFYCLLYSENVALKPDHQKHPLGSMNIQILWQSVPRPEDECARLTDCQSVQNRTHLAGAAENVKLLSCLPRVPHSSSDLLKTSNTPTNLLNPIQPASVLYSLLLFLLLSVPLPLSLP